jgi:hypothetical protein
VPHKTRDDGNEQRRSVGQAAQTCLTPDRRLDRRRRRRQRHRRVVGVAHWGLLRNDRAGSNDAAANPAAVGEIEGGIIRQLRFRHMGKRSSADGHARWHGSQNGQRYQKSFHESGCGDDGLARPPLLAMRQGALMALSGPVREPIVQSEAAKADPRTVRAIYKHSPDD